MKLFEAIPGTLNPNKFYITREVQMLAQVSAKGSYALENLYLNAKEGLLVATDGHILAVRPLRYKYEGPSALLKITGKLLGTKDYVTIDAKDLEGEEDIEIDGPRGLLVIEKLPPNDFPEIGALVYEAVEKTTHHQFGVNLKLLQTLVKALGTKHVKVCLGEDPLKPIVVYSNQKDDSLVVTQEGVSEDAYGVIMPLRLD